MAPCGLHVKQTLVYIKPPSNPVGAKRHLSPRPIIVKTIEHAHLLDLSFTRIVDAPRAEIWRAWTEPELLKQWFCPLPWKTIDAEIDLRPGGLFRTVMKSPEGKEFPNLGCFLEVVPNQKLVWTNALLAGFRPSVPSPTCGEEQVDFKFTAKVELADHGDGTRYSATVVHADEAACEQHAAMGFEQGWGAALDQLLAMIKRGI